MAYPYDYAFGPGAIPPSVRVGEGLSGLNQALEAPFEAERRRRAAEAQAAAIAGKSLPPSPPATTPLPPEVAPPSPPPPEDFQSRPGPGYFAARVPQGGGLADKIVFTNRPEEYSSSGADVLGGALARREAQAVQQEPMTLRNPASEYFGSAEVTPGREGGFVFGGGELTEEGKTDWSKVANPQAFEAFNKDPVANIEAERAADLAKSRAIAADPFAAEKAKAEAAKDIARAPFEEQRIQEAQRMEQLKQFDTQARDWAMKQPGFATLPQEIQQRLIEKKRERLLREFLIALGRFNFRSAEELTY